ncbi:hypothetical protein TrVE_jg9095 [Triparma verrucosa]|uniref:Casein kinase I n=1 Tax=Triparma verrucosa TaxID=1606542 RepID=A0A9W7EYR3_9STRA|nr:hypothetical protein TrVE_jg9095 [Triparma verrucosa]
MSKSAEGKITNNKNKDWCQDWCVKFAEHHEPTKGKKKKKTDKQRNSDQIYYEYQLYSNSCSSGRGVWCPDIPDLRLRPYGEVEHNGQMYRYLIMEKIKHEVFKGCKSTSDVVDRTVQVLMALKELHESGLVFVDIKPDNLRLDEDGNVRLIDFGCVERYVKADGKHRDDAGGGGGTPDYWSRRVSSNEGCSVGRVDDVEAVLFCMLEEIEGELPWSGAGSDEEMARVKREWGEKQGGVWDYLAGLRYSDAVDYDEVAEGLNELKKCGGGGKRGGKSPVKKKATAAAAKKKSPVRKKQSPAAKKKKQEVIEILESSEEEVEEVKEAEEMDVEESEEEEEEDPPLYLVFESGPDASAVFSVTSETCKVQRSKGSPSKRKRQHGQDDTNITLNDKEVSTNHAYLSVKYSRKKGVVISSSLIVKDLGSSNGTFINGKKLDAKKSRAAFINDSVRFGASVCRVKDHV